MTVLFHQIAKYMAVGALNTLIGILCIFGAMKLGFNDIYSNFLGYIAGFIVGYCINGTWTFQSKLDRSKTAKYAAVMACSYAANIAFMLIARDLFETGRYLAQVVGIFAYTTLGFLGSRYYVFKPA